MSEPRDLKERTTRGLAWSGVNSGMTQLLNLVIGVFLARLLSPGDYGIVGVLAIFSALAGNLQDAGFTQSLINLKRPEARDYNSVFWFSAAVSLCLYLLLFAAAPLIAAFYRAEELVPLSRVLFLGFFIAALSIPSGAWLKKNLCNREIALIGITALTLSGVAGIAVAFAGGRHWALVVQQLSYIGITTVGRFVCCPWRPSLSWEFAPVRGMMRFGVNIFLTNVVNTLSQNLFTVIFGRIFSKAVTGFYTRANMWNNMGHQLVTNTVNQLAQAVFVEVGDDREREERVWRKMLRFTAFVSMPAMLGLALVAREVTAILGPQWGPSAPLLRVLALGGAFMPLYALYQNLLISHGRGRTYLWLNVGQVALLLAAALVLAPRGVMTMVAAYSAVQVLWLLPWQWAAGRISALRWTSVVGDVMPYLLSSLLTTGLTWGLTEPLEQSPFWVLLPVRIVLAAVLYGALMWARRDDIFLEILRFLRR